MTKHVAVLMGGWSAEREVSLRSGAACARALRDEGCQVTEIDVTVDLDDSEKVRWIVSKVDLADYEALVKNEEVGIEKLRKAEFAKRRRTIFQDLVDSEDKAEITSLPIYSGKDKTAAEQPQPAAAKPII